MNKFFLLLVLSFTSILSPGQRIYPYGDIKLDKQSDYAETESLALSAANYLLTVPFAEAEKNRSDALQFLSTWMTGYKEFTFYKQGLLQDLAEDKNILSIYIAAVAKYSLENKTTSQNPLVVEINASKMTLNYCDNPVNHFKLKKKLRKMLEKN